MVLKWHTGKLCTFFKMDSYDIVLLTLLSWVTRLGETGSMSFNLLLEIYLMDACQYVNSAWKTNKIRAKHRH